MVAAAQLGADVERELAGHPDFGDSARITRRALARYRFALEILGRRWPELADLDADAVPEPVLRDPVVRMAVERALRGVAGGAAELAEVLAEIRPGSAALPPTRAEGTTLARCGWDDAVWLMDFDTDLGPLRRRLHAAVLADFLGTNGLTGTVHPMDLVAVAHLDRAAELLTTVLPCLGHVLSHVAAVGLLTARGDGIRQRSASGGDLAPGTVVLDPERLDDPWGAAAILLHEALHLKLFDISRVFALVADGDAAVPIPWRTAPWNVTRVLFAYHVYVHLALFDVAAAGDRLTAAFGPRPDTSGASVGTTAEYAEVRERAGYLGAQLAGPLAPHLTGDGRRLVRWLAETAASLTGSANPSVPAEPPDDLPSGPPGQSVPVPGGLSGRPAGPSVPDELSPTSDGRVEAPVPSYRQAPGLFTRAAPEAELLFVFDPARGALRSLPLATWAAFALCDGRPDVERDYLDLVSGRQAPAVATRRLRVALAQLEHHGLVVRTEGRWEGGGTS